MCFISFGKYKIAYKIHFLLYLKYKSAEYTSRYFNYVFQMHVFRTFYNSGRYLFGRIGFDADAIHLQNPIATSEPSDVGRGPAHHAVNQQQVLAISSIEPHFKPT